MTEYDDVLVPDDFKRGALVGNVDACTTRDYGVSEVDRPRLSSPPTFDYDKAQPIMVQFLDLREK